MEDRGDRRTPVNSALMARYSYLQASQTPLSPGPGFDPSLSNVPITMSSSAGLSMPTFRPGQNVISDIAESVISQTDGAHSAGKTSSRPHNMDSMHGLASRDSVGNMYNYSNYMNPPGNSFAMPEGMGDRADLFMSQLGLTGRLPHSSLYSSLPQDSGSHRSGESGTPSPLHSAAERSILSRSVPPYLPLGSESNYVYFNPPPLSSIGAAELSLSAGVHSGLGSFVNPPPSYSPSSTASRLRTCFPTMSTSSAYNLSVGSHENKQASASDSMSKESYDVPWNLTHGPPEWNTARKPQNPRRDEEMFETHYKQSKPTSPETDSDIQSVIDQSLPGNYEAMKKNEDKISSTKTDTYAATSQNGAYYRAVPQGSSERMFQESDSNLMSTDFRNVSPHATNNKSMTAAVGRSDESAATESKYPSQPVDRRKGPATKRPIAAAPVFANASTMTPQQMSKPLPPASTLTAQARSASFTVTPSMYSDSSESEQSSDLNTSSASQKSLGTIKTTKMPITNHSTYVPMKGAVQWKKKQLQQARLLAASSAKAAVKACDFGSQTQTEQTEEEFVPKWQTFTKVSEFSEEEEGLENPPRIKLVIKKSIPPKQTPTKSPKAVYTANTFTFMKGKGRLEKRTCGICSKTFTRADSLNCHMRVHTGDRPYQCQLCDAAYKIAGQLRDHVRSRHSNSRPFICSKCGKDFAYATAKRRHEKVCGVDLSERIEFQCPTCDKGFVTAKGFSKHLETCSPSAIEHGIGRNKDSPFRCSVCEKAFTSFPCLDRHQRFICGRIPQKGIYSCEECGKMFHTRNRYITHTRRHVGEKPYKCSQCESSFYDKGTLKRHIERWHEENGKFNCSPCGKRFFDVRSWKKHMVQQHDSQFVEPMHLLNRWGGRMKQHMCKVCGRSFVWRRLRSHVNAEHPGMSLSEALSTELLKCDICFKEFSCRQILRVHKRGHSSSQRYKCSRCNMQFAVKSVLGYHVQMHCQGSDANKDDISVHMGVGTGDRPYQCQLCDASYKIAGHLRDHVRSKHSTSRPYLCAKCGKDFAYSTARRRHEKVCGVDLSERIQFQCSACDKGFVTAKGFSKHQVTCPNMKTDSESIEKPFKCTTCEKAFPTFPSLDRHQRFICGRVPQKGIYACEECGKMFYKRDRYITHTRRHAGEKPFKCPQCELCFFDNITLKTHMDKWHEGSGNYKCTLCNRDFFYERTFKIHVRRHSMELGNALSSLSRESFKSRMIKQYTCKICSKSFAWRGLCAHMTAEHPGVAVKEGVNKDLLKCDVCSKEFSCPQSLCLHKRKHFSSKSFKCDRCDLQFAMKSSFMAHCRTHHADSQPHRCEECGKDFRWLHSLTHHKMMQHGGLAEDKDKTIERYTCNECGKHFKQENFLYLHLKLKQHGNSQDTPCICSKCGRGFCRMSDYKTHMASHSMDVPNRKPFSCDECGIGFQYRNLLERHMKRTHNQQIPYFPVEDGKPFMFKEHLKKQSAPLEKFMPSTVSKLDHAQPAAKHGISDFAQTESGNSNQAQAAVKSDMEGHLGLPNRLYNMPSTSSGDLARDSYSGLPMPNDALPNFSTFENQNYPRHYSTFIHQTLAWPRPEEHCTEEG